MRRVARSSPGYLTAIPRALGKPAAQPHRPLAGAANIPARSRPGQVDVAGGPSVTSCSGRSTSPRRTTGLLATLRGKLGGERQECDAEDSQIGLDRTRTDRVPFGE